MIEHARLLAGPPAGAGPESLAEHVARLGRLPSAGPGLIKAIDGSGLVGRGGAGFPAGRKWAAVAHNSAGDARVLVNGAEGEPLSSKDRLLMAIRPQLVIDGALLAAQAVGATEIVFYIGAAYHDAQLAMRRALAERQRLPARARFVAAPHAYVAGEESAAVHFINDGDARPVVTPPRPFERGIDGRPTLVQNVETLAHIALIARFGDAWYRELGRGQAKGTTLVTISGAGTGGVREIELGTRIGELAAAVGAAPESTQAVLVGGYFGRWVAREQAWGLPLDPIALKAAGASLGSGVISFLATDQCGVAASAQVLDYMAAQSAAQCGPCVFGLRAIADTAIALADNLATGHDIERLDRWAGQVHGRGACHHPNGAIGLLGSAMAVFGRDMAIHARRGGCATRVRAAVAA